MSDRFLEQLQSSLGPAYTLKCELGGGGMARVFVAEEVALGRTVVIKVLAPELAQGVSVERFEREIRFAARLQHPNIVPLYAAGESAGLPYYTMPFVEGETLRVRLDAGPLETRAAIRVLEDMARALAHAHAQGIVHRDVKPENVLLSGGVAAVADFGIAKALAAARGEPETGALTQFGVALGTPAYMAPEQAAGDPNADARADIYAWGVIAYEMLAGSHPFAGERSAQALIAAHFVQTPPSLAALHPDLPLPLVALVERCLAKDPDHRYADGRALSESLEQLAIDTLATAARRMVAATIEQAGVRTPRPRRAIAVLPLVNTSGDAENEHFSDGLTDELIGALSTVGSLRVTGRTSSFALKGKGLGVAEVARTLAVDTVLEGSVRRAGTRLKASVQLVGAEGDVMWSAVFDRTVTDVFEVQEEIAQAVVHALEIRLGGASIPLVRPATLDVVAHDLYLRGRFVARAGNPSALREAMGYWMQAIQRDPSFAGAHAALATTYAFLTIAGDVRPRDVAALAREHAKRALELDAGSAYAHRSMAHVHYVVDLDLPATGRALRRALELEPGSAETHQFYAVLLNGQRYFDEAEAHATIAFAADPFMRLTRMTLGWVYLASGRPERALEYLERVVEVAPLLLFARELLVHAYLVLGRADDALAECMRAVEAGGRRERALLAYVHAVGGRRDAARALLEELLAPAQIHLAPPCHMAYAYAGLGDADTALLWLERAFEAEDPHLTGLAITPAYDALRGDARFVALVARMRRGPAMRA